MYVVYSKYNDFNVLRYIKKINISNINILKTHMNQWRIQTQEIIILKHSFQLKGLSFFYKV